MRFENKGARTFLVCDSAIRARGCRAIRWDYQEFETAFLVFVEEIDLGSFLGSSGEALERRAIDNAIAAITAQIKTMETERANVYALLQFQGADISYVSERLRECEANLDGSRNELSVLVARRHETASERASYYKSKDDLAALIMRITGRDASDTYKLRAQVASRLQAVVSSLTLSPAGGLPVASWDIAPPTDNDPSYSADLGIDEPRQGRYFTVCFKDGSFRTVFPKSDNAFSFHQQIVWGRTECYLLEGDAGFSDLIDLEQFRPASDREPG